MKSNIIEKEDEWIKYPKLMVIVEHPNIGTVVLFACEKEGVVVHGKGIHKPGHFSVG